MAKTFFMMLGCLIASIIVATHGLPIIGGMAIMFFGFITLCSLIAFHANEPEHKAVDIEAVIAHTISKERARQKVKTFVANQSL